MQVGAADGARADLNNGIARMLDLRIRNCVDENVAMTVPAQCAHLLLLMNGVVSVTCGRAKRRATDSVTNFPAEAPATCPSSRLAQTPPEKLIVSPYLVFDACRSCDRLNLF